MMATEWVAPGAGTEAGILWDLAVNSVALKESEQHVKQQFASHGVLDEEQRQRKTRLMYRYHPQISILTGYDIERIVAAIWEFDQPGEGEDDAVPGSAETA